jgi:dienelactone hydrolase
MKADRMPHLAGQAFALLVVLMLAREAMSAEWLVDGVPLPDDVGVAPAPDNATEPSKRFLGAWVGAWDDHLKHVLIVEEVRADGTVRLVSALGDNPMAGVPRHWIRTSAVVSGDTLTIAASTSSYTLDASGTLTAVFQRGRARSNARLSKTTLDTLLRPGATVAWSKRVVERIDTSLVEDGKPVRLEVVSFKPDGAGPFPLLVINHGSTGSGADPRLFKETRWSFAVAEFFTRKGWFVAFPHRRGRGNSDGLYDEGFESDRRRGYTCDPTRSLAGADRALEDVQAALAVLRRRPDVDARRVVMGGISRGGVLSIAYAGRHPGDVLGVINFVGGWVGTGCPTAAQVNGALFRQGATFTGPTIWLYGKEDQYYSIDHSRANFTAFESAGGKGTFVVFDVPGSGNGHALNGYLELWAPHVDSFMAQIDAVGPK